MLITQEDHTYYECANYTCENVAQEQNYEFLTRHNTTEEEEAAATATKKGCMYVCMFEQKIV